MSAAQDSRTEKLINELASLQRDVHEIKISLAKLNQERSSRRRLGRRKQTPDEEVQAGGQSGQIQELLTLLPQLGEIFPQLNQPKMAETVKALANPALIHMLQQIAKNGAGKNQVKH